MSLGALTSAAKLERLQILGHFPTLVEDGLGDGTLALLGPASGFWLHVTNAPEWRDGKPDPIDRWSRRVIEGMAEMLGGAAYFPFGEPLRPFMTWALRTGRAWSSPVGLLVHDEAGLMVSYRGAVLLPARTVAPTVKSRPCDTCPDTPCITACPVGALTDARYDLEACHGFLDTPEGETCMTGGCLVRRACPVSQRYDRDADQSSYHMRMFHP